MTHADTIPHKLSGFDTSTDLRNAQRALAIKRYAERAGAAEPGPPEERPGSLALAPRQIGAARRGQFGLVYQVAGANSTVDSYHDELARFGGSGDAEIGNTGHSGFDSASSLDDSAWGYFPTNNVLAKLGQGMSHC